MRTRRAFGGVLLLAVILSGSGCVTVVVQGSLESVRPTHSFDGIARAWLVAGADGHERLAVHFSLHTVSVARAIPFGCNLPMLGPSAVVYYRLDADEEALEIDAFEVVSANWLPPAGREVQIVEKGQSSQAAMYLERPATLHHAGGVSQLERSWRPRHLPAQAAQVATLPITVAADVALLPVYTVALAGLFTYAGLHDLLRWARRPARRSLPKATVDGDGGSGGSAPFARHQRFRGSTRVRTMIDEGPV